MQRRLVIPSRKARNLALRFEVRACCTPAHGALRWCGRGIYRFRSNTRKPTGISSLLRCGKLAPTLL
jgi:hypothetical protein